MTAVRAVGIFRTQATGGGVLVDHRVHTAWGNAEEEARTAELLEVAEVAVPVGLRYDGHAVTGSLERASDDGCAERRVVDISVAGKKDDIQLIPSPEFQLLLRRRQKVRQPVFHQLKGVPWMERVVEPRLSLPLSFQLI